MIKAGAVVRGPLVRSGLVALTVLATACRSGAGTTPAAQQAPAPPPPAAVPSPATAPQAPAPTTPVTAATPSKPVSMPTPANVRTTGAAVPGPPIAKALANLGGDQHPIIPEEPFGTIEIPKIGLAHPIYEGIDLPQFHWGPGHWPGSAMPGEVGNAVFAGHRVTHTRPFLNIDKLVPGDQIIFTTAAGRFVYALTGHEIVTPEDVSIVDPTPTPTLTLMACHPKGSASQRYVVHAKLVE